MNESLSRLLLPHNHVCGAFTLGSAYTTSSMVSGSSAWYGVCGSVALLCVCLGGSCVRVACVFGVRGLEPVSLSLLGRSALDSRLMCAVEGPARVVAAAAAAPVSLLGTGGFAPAEAELLARADMGRASHGECTAVVSPSFPLSFVVFFFAICIGWKNESNGNSFFFENGFIFNVIKHCFIFVRFNVLKWGPIRPKCSVTSSNYNTLGTDKVFFRGCYFKYSIRFYKGFNLLVC